MLTLNSFKLSKVEKAFLISGLVLFVTLFLSANIYWVANKFGIHLAASWYEKLVDWVANGGSIVTGFATIAGISLPAWIGPVVAGFGTVAA